ncbi:hypothetical protein TBLA_0F03620 [Henningerozyma blattae CBS 6284]|uniref:BSD domain-containing protein n=1 Tax=Henningerozyma blattae (strain ATCC 34711 / CBS 6284 / DSM 70876 / NBRC 10599 / NRRL Y-10934 / UCD 77-7) TaxID=1071380 RepID=I2H697_HENB6|nr:hypothetical protein TBLA_0F03620 [Tetrapisispora blattae CBS 6284]CCH61899.1 hypothetical protein TBLA_0F03620 [Tetrapisispora blattae CBS 6284]
MDFVYEEQVLANEATPDPNQKHDEKTEQLFENLENNINTNYEKTKGLIENFLHEDDSNEGINIDLPISDEYTAKANELLANLDNGLKSVETKVTDTVNSYWNNFSVNSLWDSINTATNSALNSKAPQPNSNVVLAGNRTEAELQKLSTDKSIYLKDLSIKVDPKVVDIDSKTDEIAKLLEVNKNLSSLMNDIVPSKINYQTFWYIYFTEKTKILDMETKRKTLLNSSKTSTQAIKDADEDLGWDDDDDDDDFDNTDSKSEPPVIIQKKDAIEEPLTKRQNASSKTKQSAKLTENTTTAQAKAADISKDDDDDDDDDWE